MSRRTKRGIPQRQTGFFERRIKGMPDQVADTRNPEYRNIERQNRMVDEADAMLKGMPGPVAENPAAQAATDAIMTAKYLPTDRRAQIAAAGLGAAGLAGAGLQAYGELSEEYAPRDFLSVAGRTAKNLNPLSGMGGVGVDPLQEARNNVAAAAKIVGTENMLEALAADEINQLRAQQEMAMTPVELEGLSGVQAMIDARAQQLMSEPIQKSDGSVGPMGFDTAQRIATEQVAMELRAGQVY